MSVTPSKANIHQRGLHVRLVPIADIWLCHELPYAAAQSHRISPPEMALWTLHPDFLLSWRISALKTAIPGARQGKTKKLPSTFRE
jgi:hypothetical protein